MKRLLLLACLAATAVAGSATAAGIPSKYRYAGWLTPCPGCSPKHLVVEGDGPSLNFADAWNLTSTPMPYRV